MRKLFAVAGTLASLALPASASAVEFGVSDDGAVINHPELLTEARNNMDARWVRFMVHRGQESKYEAAIRNADAAGMKILVTLYGGPQDSFPGWARYMASRWRNVDAWGIENEPELRRIPVCTYVWMYDRARREIRRSSSAPVLFGELSPHAWKYVEMMRGCRKLRKRPDGIAIHPYQGSDPLSSAVGSPWSDRPKRWRDPVSGERWTKRSEWIGIGRMKKFRRVLRQSRLSAPLWFTEFGFLHGSTTDEQQSSWWPRAFVSSERSRARVLIAHGFHTFGEKRNWNSPLGPRTREALARAARAR